MSRRQKNILAICLAGLFGLLAFLFIYSEVLNPTYVGWLLSAGPDPVQHYIGWLMYRQADWTWPLGLANNYGYPFGIPITYTDSIPLLAIFFKIFKGLLPANWQYFGFWIALCFILQGIFAYLLLRIKLNRPSLAVLGSIIFILSPIMLFRLGGHFALGGHWLILWGLYLLLRKHQNLHWLNWSGLLVLSLLVHPYLLFMNAFLMLADWLHLVIIQKSVRWPRTIIMASLQIGLVYLVAYGLGLFAIGQATAPGYGDFSMNLNALINPLGWSRLFSDLPIINYQAEGFNYLGAGVLGLLIISACVFIKNKVYQNLKFNNWPLWLVVILLTIISVSQIVVFNSTILFTWPLSDNLQNNFFGLFRSSGRFFWPVFYLIVLVAFYAIRKINFKISLFLLLLAIGLQIFDLSSKLISRSQEFVNQVHYNTVLLSGLDEIGANNYRHIVFMPVISHRNYMDFVIYAATHQMTINDGYFARPIAGLEEELTRQMDLIKAGQPAVDTLYVFSRNVDILSANIDQTKHLITTIDDTTLLLPDYYQP